MAQKVSKREIDATYALHDEMSGRAGLEQCPGCPAGGMFRPDPNNELVDGCEWHSTERYNAVHDNGAR